MPIKCFETRLKLTRRRADACHAAISTQRASRPPTPFGQFAKRARSEAGWRYHEIDASHSPNVTAPEALMALLQKIVA